MKCFLIIACLMLAPVWGQQWDTRALIDADGNISKISVMPDGKILLGTRMGKLYYADNIGENWHSQSSPVHNDDDLTNDLLDQIDSFDANNVMLSGYMKWGEKDKHAALYVSQDACKTWKMINFKDDSWIYTTFVDRTGRAWIGGSSGKINYSEDFGQHWQTRNSPYNDDSRLNAIFMRNGSTGISGALDNHIYETKDNWQSFSRISTPIDQKMYDPDRNDDKIEKIIYWQNYIVVNQSGRIFYTEAVHINWKRFPIKLSDFELQADNHFNLFGITKDRKVVLFTAPENYAIISKSPLNTDSYDIKSVKNILYILQDDQSVYKVSNDTYEHQLPYTTDLPINLPNIVKQNGSLSWGATSNHLYLSDSKGNYNWYREHVFDFPIGDLVVENDSTALVWDEQGRNIYTYSLQTHKATPYHPVNPIGDFLKSGISRFSIEAGSMGCFHNVSNIISYVRKDDGPRFETTGVVATGNKEQKDIAFANSTSVSELEAILSGYNAQPEAFPTIQDFKITKNDKQAYLKMVSDMTNGSYDSIKASDKTFYDAVADKLDTIEPAVLAKVLSEPESLRSTTINWYKITLENKSGAQIEIFKSYCENVAWQLPWQIGYKGKMLNCYNLDLSRYINAAIPEKFFDKEVFDNRWLIMKIANYLKQQKREEE